MFLFFQEAFATNFALGTLTTDINMSPSDIAANADMNAVEIFPSGIVASGFIEFTTVNPDTGIPTQNSLGGSDFFECASVFFANNVDTVTFFTLVADLGGITRISGTCQIFFFDQNGNLS
jgi:hypothetical protein